MRRNTLNNIIIMKHGQKYTKQHNSNENIHRDTLKQYNNNETCIEIH